MIHTLHTCYQDVIYHIAVELRSRQHAGRAEDAIAVNLLRKRHAWLTERMNTLAECRQRTIRLLHRQLDAYIEMCEDFWKEVHPKTYEEKMDILLEAKKKAALLYSLSGFDAYYMLFTSLKLFRSLLPGEGQIQRDRAVDALQAIKENCTLHLRSYLKPRM